MYLVKFFLQKSNIRKKSWTHEQTNEWTKHLSFVWNIFCLISVFPDGKSECFIPRTRNLSPVATLSATRRCSQVDDPPPSSTSASSHRSNMICYNNLCVFKILCLSWIKSGNSNISIFSSWKTCKNNNLRNLANSTLIFSKIKKSWGAGIWLWWKQVGQHFSVFTSPATVRAWEGEGT